jgi:signal transduction histidine kinase
LVVVQILFGGMVREFTRTSGTELVPKIAFILESSLDEDEIQEALDLTAVLSGIKIEIVDSEKEILYISDPSSLEDSDFDFFTNFFPRQNQPRTLRNQLRFNLLEDVLVDRFDLKLEFFHDFDPFEEEFGMGRDLKRFWDESSNEIAGGIQFTLPDYEPSYVRLYLSNNPIDRINGLFLMGFAVAALLSLLVAIVLAKTASIRLTQPLKVLEKGANILSEGTLSHRVYLEGNDEISRLADQFNHMAKQLESNFEKIRKDKQMMKNFLADASHELRTPITAATTFVDLLSRFQSEASQKEKGLQEDIAKQLTRLKEISEKLLQLSYLEQRKDDFDTIIDHPQSSILPVLDQTLIELKKRNTQQWGGDNVVSFYETSENGERITKLEKLEDYSTELDRLIALPDELLKTLIKNVIQNALHSQVGNEQIRLNIVLSNFSDSLGMYIIDSGPGISKQDLNRLGDLRVSEILRFYPIIQLVRCFFTRQTEQYLASLES